MHLGLEGPARQMWIPLCQAASLCCWGEPSDRRAAVCSSARWEQHHVLSGSGLNELDVRRLAQCLRGEGRLHVIKWLGLGNSAAFCELAPCQVTRVLSVEWCLYSSLFPSAHFQLLCRRFIFVNRT